MSDGLPEFLAVLAPNGDGAHAIRLEPRERNVGLERQIVAAEGDGVVGPLLHPVGGHGETLARELLDGRKRVGPLSDRAGHEETEIGVVPLRPHGGAVFHGLGNVRGEGIALFELAEVHHLGGRQQHNQHGESAAHGGRQPVHPGLRGERGDQPERQLHLQLVAVRLGKEMAGNHRLAQRDAGRHPGEEGEKAHPPVVGPARQKLP